MAEITSTIGKVGSAAKPAAKADPHAAEAAASIPQALQPGLDPDLGPPLPPLEGKEEEEKKEPISATTLRALIELGKVRETITIGGLEFEVETLDDDAQEDLFKKLANLDAEGADSFVNLRRVVVAMSVVSVNGQPFETFDPSAEGDGVDKKISIARRMQTNVIDKLYDFYNSLLEESQKKIDPEQVKN